ncbi:MAG: hypothetical protein GY906_33980 [bacterium]|nr:hypothetical protein [bacterium]
MVPKLTMESYLQTVHDHGLKAFEELQFRGFHNATIVRKSQKAAQRGYTDYGIASHRAWITELGKKFLRESVGT